MFRTPKHNRRRRLVNPHVGFKPDAILCVTPSPTATAEADVVRFDREGFAVLWNPANLPQETGTWFVGYNGSVQRLA